MAAPSTGMSVGHEGNNTTSVTIAATRRAKSRFLIHVCSGRRAPFSQSDRNRFFKFSLDALRS